MCLFKCTPSYVAIIFTGDLSAKIEDALALSNKFLIALVENHKSMQQIIHEKIGSSLLDIMEALMRLPGLRATLRGMMLTNSK